MTRESHWFSFRRKVSPPIDPFLAQAVQALSGVERAMAVLKELDRLLYQMEVRRDFPCKSAEVKRAHNILNFQRLELHGFIERLKENDAYPDP